MERTCRRTSGGARERGPYRRNRRGAHPKGCVISHASAGCRRQPGVHRASWPRLPIRRDWATDPANLRGPSSAQGIRMASLDTASLRLGRAALAAAALAFAGPAAAQTGAPPPAKAPAEKPPDTPVARVDGGLITEGDLAIAAEDPALSLPGMGESQKHDLLVGYLIDLRLGAAAAEAAKVGEGAEFARK